MNAAPYYVWRRDDGYIVCTRYKTLNNDLTLLLETHSWTEAYDRVKAERERPVPLVVSHDDVWQWILPALRTAIPGGPNEAYQLETLIKYLEGELGITKVYGLPQRESVQRNQIRQPGGEPWEEPE